MKNINPLNFKLIRLEFVVWYLFVIWDLEFGILLSL